MLVDFIITKQLLKIDIVIINFFFLKDLNTFASDYCFNVKVITIQLYNNINFLYYTKKNLFKKAKYKIFIIALS